MLYTHSLLCTTSMNESDALRFFLVGQSVSLRFRSSDGVVLELGEHLAICCYCRCDRGSTTVLYSRCVREVSNTITKTNESMCQGTTARTKSA